MNYAYRAFQTLSIPVPKNKNSNIKALLKYDRTFDKPVTTPPLLDSRYGVKVEVLSGAALISLPRARQEGARGGSKRAKSRL